MTTPHYYIYPFGQNADDLAAIPDSAAVNGSVSYFYGWTDLYEYNLLTNPAALPIPRGQMNQLFFDITNNIQEYQQYGAPQWVTGNTVLYPVFARVYYLGEVYENQVADNTQTPGVDSTWRVVSGNVGGLPIGTSIDFRGPIVPVNFLLEDGGAVSRATYASLLSVLTQTQNGTTTNTLATLTGLSDTSNMYIGMPLEGSGIPAGTTVLLITSPSAITMSQNATASATVPVQFFSYGNGDGSTTFNLPDARRSTSIGSGGSGTSIIGNVTGQSGGIESGNILLDEMANHTHGVTYWANQNPGPISNSGGTIATSTAPGGINGWGPQTPLSRIQPSLVCTKCIKYQ